MAITFPLAGAIPGSYGGQAPQWWAPLDADSSKLGDPRWIGAVNRSYDNGTGLEAAFRGLYHVDGGQPYLLMSFQAFTDPKADQNDLVWLGLQRQAGSTPYIVQINAPATAPNTQDDIATGGVSWNVVPEGGGTRSALPGGVTPPELEARYWIVAPGLGSNDFQWGINIRIPVTSGGADLGASGINLGNIGGGASFRFWFTIIVDHDVVDPNDPNSGVAVPYPYPRTGANLTGTHLSPSFPATANWDTATAVSGANGGISLTGSDISANSGTDQIKASLTTPQTNHFKIRPKNNGITPDIPTGAIQGTARIANWGSQTPIDKAPAGFTTWQPIPFTGNPPNPPTSSPATPTNSAPIGNGNLGDIDFDWLIDTTTAGYWVGPNPILDLHQCVMAELEQVGGTTGYDFVNDSAYWNMNILPTASPATRTVEISTRGRPPTTGGGGAQKVYVFVERTSAPATVAAGEKVPGEPQLLLRAAPQMTDMPARDVGGVAGAGAVIEAIPEVDVDLLAQRVPTLRYHTYYSTGIKIQTRSGRTVTLYDPQTSFGYFVLHQGAVYGWSHDLVPAAHPAAGLARGEKPQRIGGDHFAVDVPHGGAVAFDTIITPLEEPPKDGGGGGVKLPGGCTGSAAVLAAFVAGLVKLLR